MELVAKVDLGSQCVLLKEENAREMGLNYAKLITLIKIRGFGEEAVEVIGKTEAFLKLDKVTAKLRF